MGAHKKTYTLIGGKILKSKRVKIKFKGEHGVNRNQNSKLQKEKHSNSRGEKKTTCVKLKKNRIL